MNLWKTSTFVLAGALALTVIYETAKPAHADPQPNMQAALTALQTAKDKLQNATADKGGHRVKAIAATNEAISEVRAGIDFDNKH